jgi:hypothetical protein
VADAEAVHNVLTKQAGFRADRVILMTDKAAEVVNRPLLTNLRDRVRQVTRFPQAGDTLFLYYSGHGDRVQDDKGNKTGYLIPMDGNTQLNAKGEMENAISFSWLRERVEECKATTKVVVLDTCQAGSATKGVGGITASLTSAVLLLSCKEGQVSYTDDAVGRSVFSQFLTAGLAGAADANKDSQVAVSELIAYVRGQMQAWVLKTSKDQDPVIECPEAVGRLVLANVVPGARPEQHVDDPEANKRIWEILHKKKVTLDFVETPIGDVLEFFRQLVGANIILDPRIDKATPVTLRMSETQCDLVLQRVARLAKARLSVRNGAAIVEPADDEQQKIK